MCEPARYQPKTHEVELGFNLHKYVLRNPRNPSLYLSMEMSGIKSMFDLRGYSLPYSSFIHHALCLSIHIEHRGTALRSLSGINSGLDWGTKSSVMESSGP